MTRLKSTNADPRAAMEVDELKAANAQIASPVAMPAGLSPGLKLGFIGIGLLGILTFTTLATSRSDANERASTSASAAAVPSAIPKGGLVPPATLRPGPPELPPPALIPPPANGAPVLGLVGPSTASGANRFQSPGVVVDLTKGGAALLPPTPGLAGTKDDGLSAEDRFADRVARAENAPARAVRIANSSYTVPRRRDHRRGARNRHQQRLAGLCPRRRQPRCHGV